jgi:HTH-type transcriptional regulator/antitoxin HipB
MQAARRVAVDYPVKTITQLRPILLGFRKAAGLTQAMVASRLGVTQQTYAQLEANPASASVERLFRVLRLLDVEMTLVHATGKPSRTAAAEGIGPAITAPATGRRGGKVATQPARGKAKAAAKSGSAAKAPRAPKSKKAAAGSSKPRSTGAAAKKRENW